MDRRVSYETGLMLKKRGFDEMCNMVYCDDIVHNGKSLSYDDELDLIDEGRGDEIKYISGGRLSNMGGARNSCDYIHETVCTAPTQTAALKWLREEHGILVLARFMYLGDGSVRYTYSIADTRSKMQYDSSAYGSCYEDVVETGMQEAMRRYLL